MIRSFKLSVGVVLLAMLTACVVPRTFEERLQAGYTSVSGVAQTTGDLMEADVITAADAENVHKQATTAKEGMDVAKSMGPGTEGETKLDASIRIMRALDAYLKTRTKGDK